MNRDKALERAIELRDHSKEFESVSFLESGIEFFDYVINELERTAPEVPVQEQSDCSITTKLGNSEVVITKDKIVTTVH